jgi:hypothetical protein
MSKLQWSITAHVICVTTKNRPRLKLLFKVKLGLDMARIICIELANFRLFLLIITVIPKTHLVVE